MHIFKPFRTGIVLCCLPLASGFTVQPASRPCRFATVSLGLAALTERQMQFWEDVEEGLDAVERVFAPKGQNIDRIRLFGKR